MAIGAFHLAFGDVQLVIEDDRLRRRIRGMRGSEEDQNKCD